MTRKEVSQVCEKGSIMAGERHTCELDVERGRDQELGGRRDW